MPPLSDRGEGNRDQEMPDADEWQGDDDPAGSGPEPVFIPDEVPERVQLGGDPADASDGEEPQEPQEPQELQEPHQVVLQGFRTVSQTLSAAYGAASSEIQKIVGRSLRTSTTEDRTFI